MNGIQSPSRCPMSTPHVTDRLARPAALLALAVIVSACGLVPSVGARSWGLFTTDQAGSGQSVQVTDTSGLVNDVQFDPADANLFEGVTAPAGMPNTLDIPWTAGPCDAATAITIVGRGPGLAVTVAITPGAVPCDAFGMPRAIRLNLAKPVLPAAVSVAQ